MIDWLPGSGGRSQFEADQLANFTDGALLIQFSDVAAGTAPITPIPLDPVGATGCALRVTPELALPFSRQGTPQMMEIAVPARRALLSLRLFAQYVDLDSAANPLGATFSNGISSQVRR